MIRHAALQAPATFSSISGPTGWGAIRRNLNCRINNQPCRNQVGSSVFFQPPLHSVYSAQSESSLNIHFALSVSAAETKKHLKCELRGAFPINFQYFFHACLYFRIPYLESKVSGMKWSRYARHTMEFLCISFQFSTSGCLRQSRQVQEQLLKREVLSDGASAPIKIFNKTSYS